MQETVVLQTGLRELWQGRAQFAMQRYDQALASHLTCTPLQHGIGVPHECLFEVRAFKAPNDSLYSFMRSLPPEQVRPPRD